MRLAPVPLADIRISLIEHPANEQSWAEFRAETRWLARWLEIWKSDAKSETLSIQLEKSLRIDCGNPGTSPSVHTRIPRWVVNRRVPSRWNFGLLENSRSIAYVGKPKPVQCRHAVPGMSLYSSR
jgi:hypothetical protein